VDKEQYLEITLPPISYSSTGNPKDFRFGQKKEIDKNLIDNDVEGLDCLDVGDYKGFFVKGERTRDSVDAGS